MSASVSEEEYVRLYEELQALVKAWDDRHPDSQATAASVLLQVGGTMAAWSGTPLEQTLACVAEAWKTADETPPGAR
jgi:hypothetical protein